MISRLTMHLTRCHTLQNHNQICVGQNHSQIFTSRASLLLWSSLLFSVCFVFHNVSSRFLSIARSLWFKLMAILDQTFNLCHMTMKHYPLLFHPYSVSEASSPVLHLSCFTFSERDFHKEGRPFLGGRRESWIVPKPNITLQQHLLNVILLLYVVFLCTPSFFDWGQIVLSIVGSRQIFHSSLPLRKLVVRSGSGIFSYHCLKIWGCTTRIWMTKDTPIPYNRSRAMICPTSS